MTIRQQTIAQVAAQIYSATFQAYIADGRDYNMFRSSQEAKNSVIIAKELVDLVDDPNSINNDNN
jgi:hypothetical protein